MGKNIYFAGSIRGGRQDVELYRQIVTHLKTYGRVFTEHVGNANLELDKEEMGLSDKDIYDRDMDWLKQSDVVVAECTQPSLGVGYELGRAVALNKKILCLFRPDSGLQLSAMVRGAENGTTLICKDYKEISEVVEFLKTFFGSL